MLGNPKGIQISFNQSTTLCEVDGCVSQSSTPASDSGALVATRFLWNCVECGTSILLNATFERSCHWAAPAQNARAHPRSAIDHRGGPPRRKS